MEKRQDLGLRWLGVHCELLSETGYPQCKLPDVSKGSGLVQESETVRKIFTNLEENPEAS